MLRLVPRCVHEPSVALFCRRVGARLGSVDPARLFQRHEVFIRTDVVIAILQLLLCRHRHVRHFPQQRRNIGERLNQLVQISLGSQALKRRYGRLKQAIQSRQWILITSPPLGIHHQPISLWLPLKQRLGQRQPMVAEELPKADLQYSVDA